MSTIGALDKPCDYALWFDRGAFDFRSACLAHVHGCKFFVSMFAHVTEWIYRIVDLLKNTYEPRNSISAWSQSSTSKPS
jgi:hypothetical protein